MQKSIFVTESIFYSTEESRQNKEGSNELKRRVKNLLSTLVTWFFTATVENKRLLVCSKYRNNNHLCCWKAESLKTICILLK